jgi:hypothetical protein
MRKIVIMGAGGRDFTFNVAFRNDPNTEVVRSPRRRSPVSPSRLPAVLAEARLIRTGSHREDELAQLVRTITSTRSSRYSTSSIKP